MALLTPVCANVGHALPVIDALNALKSEFLTLAAQWHHLGSSENYQSLGPTPGDSDLSGLGGSLALGLVKTLR